MAQALKLISEKIHLPLVLRSAVFSLAWLYLPFWAFFVLALYFYFVPLFHPGKLAPPFLAIIFFMALEPRGFLLAVLFAALFYLILGIKDFILINRQAAYEALVLLLVFFLAIEFFKGAESWSGFLPVIYSLAASLLAFLLLRSFGEYIGLGGAETRNRSVFLALAAFFFWQMLLVLSFAPLNFLYQSAILIVAVAVFLELVLDRVSGALTRRRALLQFSIFLVFAAVILGSAQWGL